jgi:hypothetical protein
MPVPIPVVLIIPGSCLRPRHSGPGCPSGRPSGVRSDTSRRGSAERVPLTSPRPRAPSSVALLADLALRRANKLPGRCVLVETRTDRQISAIGSERLERSVCVHDASDGLIEQDGNHARENRTQAENGLARNANEATRDLTTGAFAHRDSHIDSVRSRTTSTNTSSS